VSTKTRDLVKKTLELLPNSIEKRIRLMYSKIKLLLGFYYDLKNFRNYSGTFVSNKYSFEAKITKSYHIIEKGLSLKDPYAKFGLRTIKLLQKDLYDFCSQYGVNETVMYAISTLEEYITFNKNKGHDMNDLSEWIDMFKVDFANSFKTPHNGGTKLITKDYIDKNSKIDLYKFFSSRHSIRHFDDTKTIDIDIIKKAVKMAQTSPSVCNRQSARLYLVEDNLKKQNILKLQSGNRGFGDKADKILIVGVDLNCFLSAGERYQGWIDGGLFSMSLVYALHSFGLGTCCLNWSKESNIDKQLKKEAELPKNILVIMLIAVGHIPNDLKVAQSNRRNIDDVFEVI
tara:strand:- start:4956 stop:5984 length:1029 start_codon:yes stop_codon:yes gene_type:complete